MKRSFYPRGFQSEIYNAVFSVGRLFGGTGGIWFLGDHRGYCWWPMVPDLPVDGRMKSNLAPTFGKESDASMGAIIQHIGAQSANRDQVPRGPTRFEPCELVQEYGRLNGEESGDVLKSETAMASHSNLGTAAFSRFWDLAKINKWPKLGNQSST